jgi:hypothetical protein
MPPRIKKVPAAAPPAAVTAAPALPPVILVLKVTKEFVKSVQTAEVSACPEPAGGGGAVYSEILRESLGQGQQRFDDAVIHELVSKLHLATEYAPDAACFWCCHPFPGKAAFSVPTHYDTHSNTYRAEGNFCSPECGLAYTYSESRLTQSDKWLRHSLMNSLYGRLYPNSDIQPAPDKRILRLFGGTLDIQQYREFLIKATRPLHIAMPPIRLYMPSVNTQASSRDVKTYVALSVETVDKASQQLRLRRNKPVHEGVPTLDKCLGVK